MADEKISAMPTVLDIANSADLIPVVVAGLNMAVGRAAYLTRKAGEEIILQGPGNGNMGISSIGDVVIQPDAGHVVLINDPVNGTQLSLDAAGNILIFLPAGTTFSVTRGGGQFLVGSGGICSMVSNMNANAPVSYTPAVGMNWGAISPVTLHDAIDRIAAVLVVLNGGPIP